MTGQLDRRDVVFTFSFETYDDAVQRGMMRPPDRILATLLASAEIDRVLVGNPYRFVVTEGIRRVLGRSAAFPTTQRHWLHGPLRLRRADPDDEAGIRAAYRAYSRSLRRAAARRGMTRPEIITTNPLLAGFGDFGWAGGVTYFGRDDWLSSPRFEPIWPVFRQAYENIARSGMVVTAVSRQILDRIAPSGPSVVVPNGVETAEWVGPRPVAPAWFDAIAGPRAVYVGTLDSRLDVRGIQDLAHRKPDLSIVLLGPLADPEFVAPLRELHNVHVHASVGRAELIAVLRNAELTLLAHRRTALTEAMSPLKVYEYLAAGCPVISIDLEPVRDLSDRVLLVDSVSDFADVVDRALALGRQGDDEREAWVQQNSWTSRHAVILALSASNVSSELQDADNSVKSSPNT